MYVRREMSRSRRPQDDDSCIRYIVYGNSIHICKRPVASQEMPEKLDEKALSHSALTAIAHAGLGHVEDVGILQYTSVRCLDISKELLTDGM